MSAPRLGVPIVGSTSQALLDAVAPPVCVLASTPSVKEATDSVLATVLAQLPGSIRRTVPLLMAASDYCVSVASAYVQRCSDAQARRRRLRPSESSEPEPAALLRWFATHSGVEWAGSGHALVNDRTASRQAMRWAYGGVTAGRHRAIVLCEIVHDPMHDAFLVVGAPIMAEGVGQLMPTMAAPGTVEDSEADQGERSATDRSHLIRAWSHPGDPATALATRPTGSLVVVSGVGLVTSLGVGVEPFWRRLLAGERAVRELTRFDASWLRSRTVAETDVTVTQGVLFRHVLIGLALSEAQRSARLASLPSRTLLAVSGVVPHLPGLVGLPQLGEIALQPDWGGDGIVPDADNAAVLAHACASGTFGIAMAREWMECGLVDVAVIAGVSPLNVYDLAFLDSWRASSRREARPFDRGRGGLNVGEGAGVIVLETAAHAALRGHAPAAAIGGVDCRIGGESAATCDTAISAECIGEALGMAGVETVDYIQGHAPGTRLGDGAELQALEKVGAERGWVDVPVSSCKGAVGHIPHASVFPGVAIALRAIRDGVVPGTPGLRQAEPTEHVRLIADAERIDGGAGAVLVDDFGFGGNHGAVVLTAATTATPSAAVTDPVDTPGGEAHD